MSDTLLATHHERRAQLQNSLRVARDAYTQAAYKQELGKGDAKDVANAKANVAALEDQLEGLDAAVTAAKAKRVQDAANATDQRRKDAAAHAQQLMAKRIEQAKVIEKAIAALTSALTDMNETNADLRRTIGSWGDKGNYAVLIEGTIGSDHEQRYIAGALRRGGFDRFDSINFGQMARAFDGKSLADIVEFQNRKVAGWAAPSVPEIMEEAA